jgi:hypothetical protein
MKGQSAVEYVTTYGWAILFLVIIIGAILASGILTPSYFISEECYLGPSLPCNFQLYKSEENTGIALGVSNGFPYKVKITKFDITSSENPEMTTNAAESSMDILSGESKNLTVEFPGYSSSANSMKKFNVNIEYVSCAPEVNPKCEENAGLTHQISGRIFGRVVDISNQ